MNRRITQTKAKANLLDRHGLVRCLLRKVKFLITLQDPSKLEAEAEPKTPEPLTPEEVEQQARTATHKVTQYIQISKVSHLLVAVFTFWLLSEVRGIDLPEILVDSQFDFFIGWSKFFLTVVVGWAALAAYQCHQAEAKQLRGEGCSPFLAKVVITRSHRLSTVVLVGACLLNLYCVSIISEVLSDDYPDLDADTFSVLNPVVCTILMNAAFIQFPVLYLFRLKKGIDRLPEDVFSMSLEKEESGAEGGELAAKLIEGAIEMNYLQTC